MDRVVIGVVTGGYPTTTVESHSGYIFCLVYKETTSHFFILWGKFPFPLHVSSFKNVSIPGEHSRGQDHEAHSSKRNYCSHWEFVATHWTVSSSLMVEKFSISHYSFIARLRGAPCNSPLCSQITCPDKTHICRAVHHLGALLASESTAICHNSFRESLRWRLAHC